MLPDIEIRSRAGNLLLATAGLVFAISAGILLFTAIAQTRDGAGMTDRLLQMALLGAVVVSVWFVSVARRNLHAHSHEARPHRAAAAAA